MNRVIEASCSASIVQADGVPVPGATILSEGIGQSEGIAIIQGDKVYYVNSSAADLKTTIEKLVDVLTQLTGALTAIDAKPTGGAGSAVVPVAAANVVSLTAISAQLTLLAGMLK
jgi:hypothetical protein